ncbi:hypothetical protein [Cupriavidus metallidurans]|uniref:hypothetical protein n=1 Tax=Cupriavidus metallidurans TaxID=119219 RepID=UPI0007639112|nr:hypothetical protein [Cupriavidus metallidurans]KWW37660.1 hypothetical protein AU374_01427 [Cupriavidus metallidurans]
MSVVLTFGKHKGMPVNAMETDYMLWLLSQAWFRSGYPELRSAVRKVVIRRLQDEEPARATGEGFNVVSAADLMKGVLT